MKNFKNLLVASTALLTASFVSAQAWTQTSAPVTNFFWTSVASSADGSQIVAAANISDYPYNGPIYNSADSGVTWISNAFSPKPWQAIASSADGITWIATANLVVYTSTNSGVTWKTSLLAINCSGVASSADGSKLAVAAKNSIFTSTNSGNTWVSNNVPNTWFFGVSLACSADGNKLAAGDSGGSIYTSADGGGTWTSNSLTKNKQLFVTSSADGNNLAAAAGGRNLANGLIYISTNSGATWMTSSAPSLMWVSIASSADGSKLIAAAAPPNIISSNMIFNSSDFGFTWTSNNVPAPALGWSCVASSADGNKLVAGSVYGGIWTRQTTPEPRLDIASLSNSFTVSWTVPSTNFVLQQNLDLTTPNWTDVTDAPALNLTNLQDEVTLPMPAGSGFYRLKTP